MAVYKRGGVWWYEFHFKGERIRESSQVGNKAVALQIMAGHRTRLAKGEVGIVERTAAPSLAEFAPRFSEAIGTLCASRPATVTFYRERLRRLLEYAPLATCRLDAIDEALLGAFRQARTKQKSRLGGPLSVASVNRELATLRRLLRMAQEWKVIDQAPRIHLLRGEHNREFVLDYQREALYLKAAPQPLHDGAVLMLDTGLRVGEALALEWRDIHLEPAAGSRFGYLHVRGGSTKSRERNLSLTERVKAMLTARQGASRFVFPGKAGELIRVSMLDHQHGRTRTLLKLPVAFVVHSLRHTALTRLGEAGADAFTIMRIAGHSSVTVSQRYVHPSPESLETAFGRLDALNRRKRREAGKVPTVSTTGAKAEKRKRSRKLLKSQEMGA